MLEDLAIRLEIDPNYFGDSHDEKLESRFYYNDHEFDFSAAPDSNLIYAVQKCMYLLLPHFPDDMYDLESFFCLFYQLFVVQMGSMSESKCASILAMLDTGIPFQNHLGRVKFLKFVMGMIVGFQR